MLASVSIIIIITIIIIVVVVIIDLIDREVPLGQYCYWTGFRGFFFFFLFPPVQSTHATAKSNNGIIFKFLVLIQQYQAQVW